MRPAKSPGAANPRAEDAHRAGDDIVASIAPGGDKRADAERLTRRIQLRLDANRLNQHRHVLHRFNGQRLDRISTTIQRLRDDLGGDGSS